MSELDVSYFDMGNIDDEENISKYNDLFEKELKINTISIRLASESITDAVLIMRYLFIMQKKGGYSKVSFDFKDIDFNKCITNYTLNIHIQEDEFPCMMNIIRDINVLVKTIKASKSFITYLYDPDTGASDCPFGVVIITKSGVYNVNGTACVQFIMNNFYE